MELTFSWGEKAKTARAVTRSVLLEKTGCCESTRLRVGWRWLVETFLRRGRLNWSLNASRDVVCAGAAGHWDCSAETEWLVGRESVCSQGKREASGAQKYKAMANRSQTIQDLTMHGKEFAFYSARFKQVSTWPGLWRRYLQVSIRV